MNETITTIVHRRWRQRLPLIGLFFDWLDKRKWIGSELFYTPDYANEDWTPEKIKSDLERRELTGRKRKVIDYNPKTNTMKLDAGWESELDLNSSFIVIHKP